MSYFIVKSKFSHSVPASCINVNRIIIFFQQKLSKYGAQMKSIRCTQLFIIYPKIPLPESQYTKPRYSTVRIPKMQTIIEKECVQYIPEFQMTRYFQFSHPCSPSTHRKPRSKNIITFSVKTNLTALTRQQSISNRLLNRTTNISI